MKTILFILTVLAFTLHAEVKPVPATRTALLMGAWDYTDETFPPLPENGIHGDLARMQAKLESLGFVVTVVENPTSTQAEKAVDAFGAQLKTRGGASLFYFTGHGAEHEGRNYLVPVGNTNIVEGADLKEKALAANRILSRMESSGTVVNLVFLDCCRNQLSKNGSVDGMAPMQAKGTLIGFATRSGDVADTTTKGSPYTTALVAHLGDEGLSLTDMHSMVTGELVTSGSARRPGNYSDLDGIYQMVPASLSKQGPKDMRAEIERRARELAASMAAKPATADQFIIPDVQSGNHKAGDVICINLPGGLVMKFCYCPAGSFTMSSQKTAFDSFDLEQLQVRLTLGFWMAQTECTQGQWKSLMGTTPSQQKAKGNSYGEATGVGVNQPMYFVCWDDAQKFLSEMNSTVTLPSGWKFALPTEAQWEYACRAGTETSYAFGDALSKKLAQFDTTTTIEVASFKPNGWGLYDMHGNVCEWCADWYDHILRGGNDPRGATTGTFRVIHGGSWGDKATLCRVAWRGDTEPHRRDGQLGFRPALVPSR